jgi:hypothetical protein
MTIYISSKILKRTNSDIAQSFLRAKNAGSFVFLHYARINYIVQIACQCQKWVFSVTSQSSVSVPSEIFSVLEARIQCHKCEFSVTSESSVSQVKVQCHKWKFSVTRESSVSQVSFHGHKSVFTVTRESSVSQGIFFSVTSRFLSVSQVTFLQRRKCAIFSISLEIYSDLTVPIDIFVSQVRNT